MVRGIVQALKQVFQDKFLAVQQLGQGYQPPDRRLESLLVLFRQVQGTPFLDRLMEARLIFVKCFVLMLYVVQRGPPDVHFRNPLGEGFELKR